MSASAGRTWPDSNAAAIVWSRFIVPPSISGLVARQSRQSLGTRIGRVFVDGVGYSKDGFARLPPLPHTCPSPGAPFLGARFMPRRGVHSLAVLVCLAAGARAPAQEASLRDRIDQHIQQGWQSQKITPAAPADDATFLRRVYLDLVGTIPTYEETRAFLADTAPDRRSRVIDRLLESPRF